MGLPSENIICLIDQEEASSIITDIAVAAEAATDTLIVYYAGHGLYGGDSQCPLYLASRNTKFLLKDSSAVKITDVKRAMLASPARKRVLILDCCYSGSALEGTMGPDADIRPNIDVGGTFGIAAVPRDYKALALPGARLTRFTQAFVEVLESGIDIDAPVLTVAEVFRSVRAQISRDGDMALPEQMNWREGERILLAKNRRFRRNTLESTSHAPDPNAHQTLTVPQTQGRLQLCRAARRNAMIAVVMMVCFLSAAFSGWFFSPASLVRLGMLEEKQSQKEYEILLQSQLSYSAHSRVRGILCKRLCV